MYRPDRFRFEALLTAGPPLPSPDRLLHLDTHLRTSKYAHARHTDTHNKAKLAKGLLYEQPIAKPLLAGCQAVMCDQKTDTWRILVGANVGMAAMLLKPFVYTHRVEGSVCIQERFR